MNPVSASAPCRVDAGGTCDIRAIALSLPDIAPSTVNIAVDLRTRVSLLPCEEGLIRISSSGFRGSESAEPHVAPFDSRFGLFFAAVSHFGYHGLEVRVDSSSPVRSAMGGSSTALVALLLALARLEVLDGGPGRTRAEILSLSFDLEDSLSGGFCGMQDHAAAVYGGVNRWLWTYGGPRPVRRERLVKRRDFGALNQRLLIAHSGKQHVSARTNRKWAHDFLSGRTRSSWVEVNRVVKNFSDALRAKDWGRAVDLLRVEAALRRDLTPEAFIPLTDLMVSEAESLGGAARFTGAGAGGAVWALGPDSETTGKIREAWRGILAGTPGGRVIQCGVDAEGVMIEDGRDLQRGPDPLEDRERRRQAIDGHLE